MEVVWLDRAQDDLEDIRAYVAERNPVGAEKLVAKIVAAANRLDMFPHRARRGRVDETRELVITGTPYFVVYAILFDRVEIITVRHGARRWPPYL